MRRVVLVTSIIFSGLYGPLCADSFTPTPWGLDTVAGRCVVCHSLEKGGEFRVAPNLWGIVGAEKARDRAWYNYSPALIEMGGTWTVEDLDLFLANAAGLCTGIDEKHPGDGSRGTGRNHRVSLSVTRLKR